MGPGRSIWGTSLIENTVNCKYFLTSGFQGGGITEYLVSVIVGRWDGDPKERGLRVACAGISSTCHGYDAYPERCLS